MSKNTRLKQFFESENITQKEFAQKLESTQQYVSALLNGKRKLGSNILDRLEAEFDLNIAWLLTGEGSMKKGESKPFITEEPKTEYKKPMEHLMLTLHQDLKKDLSAIAQGMTTNFETLNKGVLRGLQGQQKILSFIESINPEEITKGTKELSQFLKEHK